MVDTWLDWAEKHGFTGELAANVPEFRPRNGGQEKQANPWSITASLLPLGSNPVSAAQLRQLLV